MAVAGLHPGRRLVGRTEVSVLLNVSDYRSAARRRLPRMVFGFVDGGAEDEVTLRANESDLASLRLVPEVARGCLAVDITVSLFGQRMRSPFVLGPAGLAGLLKVLALGAKACLIARPYLFGLAVNGQHGVADVVLRLQTELSRVLALTGAHRAEELDRSMLAAPYPGLTPGSASEGTPSQAGG